MLKLLTKPFIFVIRDINVYLFYFYLIKAGQLKVFILLIDSSVTCSVTVTDASFYILGCLGVCCLLNHPNLTGTAMSSLSSD